MKVNSSKQQFQNLFTSDIAYILSLSGLKIYIARQKMKTAGIQNTLYLYRFLFLPPSLLLSFQISFLFFQTLCPFFILDSNPPSLPSFLFSFFPFLSHSLSHLHTLPSPVCTHFRVHSWHKGLSYITIPSSAHIQYIEDSLWIHTSFLWNLLFLVNTLHSYCETVSSEILFFEIPFMGHNIAPNLEMWVSLYISHFLTVLAIFPKREEKSYKISFGAPKQKHLLESWRAYWRCSAASTWSWLSCLLYQCPCS